MPGDLGNYAFPRLTVVNLWGGPGSGKSTLACGLFHSLKTMGVPCEYVGEFAKDATYQRDFMSLSNQFYTLSQQEIRLWRLRGEVMYAISDSPLLMQGVYAPDADKGMIFEAATYLTKRYENIDIYVRRTKQYQRYGRLQTREQAELLDTRIRALFNRVASARHFYVDGSPESVGEIIKVFAMDAVER
jgi:hypothetical protein